MTHLLFQDWKILCKKGGGQKMIDMRPDVILDILLDRAGCGVYEYSGQDRSLR